MAAKQSLGKILMSDQNIWFGAASYQNKLRGKLGNQWSDWFEGLTVQSEGAMTIITGKILDQPALQRFTCQNQEPGPTIDLCRTS